MGVLRTCALLLLAGAVFAGCANEYTAYEETTTADTAVAYAAFLEEYPDGVNASSARQRLDEIDWEVAKKENSGGAYEEYLRMHPDGKFAERATLEGPKMAWQVADYSGDVAQVQGFLDKYGKGAYGKKASERLALLEKLPAHLSMGPAQLEVLTEGKKWRAFVEVENVGDVAVVESKLRVGWKDAAGQVARSKEWFLNCEEKPGVDAPADLTRPLSPGEKRTFEFVFVAREACGDWAADVEHLQIDVVTLKTGE
jgi:hypothetical protein